MKKLIYIVVFIIINVGLAAAQYPEVKLADEYFHKGELEKARDAYQDVIKKKIAVNHIYENYLTTLYDLEDYKTLDKFFRKLLKTQPSNIEYQIDYAILKKTTGKVQEADKMMDKTINMAKGNVMKVTLAANHFVKRGLNDKAAQTFLKARSGESKYAYAKELVEIYRIAGKTKDMMEELMNSLAEGEDNLNYVQNYLQANLHSDDYDLLEEVIYSRVQSQPGKIIYNKLLIWYYVQKKDFYSAFLQAKAVDRRADKPEKKGYQLINLGNIAYKNRDYENAVLCYEYIAENFLKSYYRNGARKSLIEAKEELVKTTYPIDKEAIQKLINNYTELQKEIRNVAHSVQISRNIARLYSFYLDDHATAKNILTKAITQNRVTPQLEAECKILLGDIHLLQNEPWESTLYYSQAEKKVKDSPTAHLAKLKNAKLSFYKGDFELAQAHLDVLKLATSREISNDAIDMSLLISDNLNLDTSAAAMQEFASIDLLIFQSKYDEAQQRLDSMLVNFPNHSLTDEIFWLKAEIFQKTAAPTKAAEYLQKILDNYAEDILGDNALFELAELYEYKLKDKKKAMELYKKLLIDFPGSIYTAESRKRFRKLRGDSVYNEDSSDSNHIHIH